MGDASKIVQVLTNLIVNSINYGKEGGHTEIRYYDADDSVLVEVADTGIGIRESDLPRVFERFYRVDKSRSRNAGGSGLGLAIVKHILESHGQSISVRSTPGEGSRLVSRCKRPDPSALTKGLDCISTPMVVGPPCPGQTPCLQEG